MKLVSVIIPNRNYGHFILQTVQSVLDQTYPNIEVIVVDNNSEDDSVEKLEHEFGNRIKLIRQKNFGQTVARNAGARASTGELLAFLDSDDWWRSDKIQKQITLLTRSTRAVACRINHTDKQGTILFETKMNSDLAISTAAISHVGVSIVECVESCFLVERTLFDEVGGFDEHLNSSAGWDLCRRISLVTNIGVSDETLVFHRMHDVNQSYNLKRNAIEFVKVYLKILRENDPRYKLNFANRGLLFLRVVWIFVKSVLKSYKNK